MKKIVFLSAMCAMLLVTVNVSAQTKVIAHRGYWDTEGSAQNSITALNKAHEIKAYGSEFDVIITSDGVTVVNHDDVIEGMRIEETPYEKIKDLKLKNGEVLPTLEEYLIAGKANNGTQLILEIKPHKTKENEDRAVAATLALVKKYHLESQVEYISFSLNISKELLKGSPKSQIAYLRGELSPKEIKEIGLTGLDYHYSVYEKNPTWIKEAHTLGLTVNAWTVNGTDVMKRLIDQQVDFITTDKPVEVQMLLK